MSKVVRIAKRATPPTIKRYAKGARRRLRRKSQYVMSIDSPRHATVATKKVTVEGWIIPRKAGNKVRAVRVRNGSAVYEAKTGLKRPDVAKSHPGFDKEAALHSGFSVEFELDENLVLLEADLGKGFKPLKKLKLTIGVEQLVSDYLNPHMSENYAEHLNLIANKKTYYYEKEQPGHFKPGKGDARLLAFYLPQFHPIPENDDVWGKGFTEWTNVGAAQPRFIGHQQPLLPADLGYYDLRNECIMLEQIELAKKYGLHGFCFYYYWFSGRRLLEKPLDSFLKHKDWDFNFTICWANENWTKRWDGRDNEVIVAQQYREEDPLEFIKDVEPILCDPRYIQEDGKPVLLVYRASELKDPARYVKVWREYFREKHGKELQLISVLSFDDKNPQEYGFDAALDFAPLTTFFKHDAFPDNKLPFVSVTNKLLDTNFEGTVMDYRSVALNEHLYDSFDFPIYKCAMPSWDNDARKKGKGFVFRGANPDIYATWLDRLVKSERQQKDEPIIFINAWNEWAEGTTLEPSQHLGHSVLARTAEVLARYSSEKANTQTFPAYGIRKNPDHSLAVVIHLYYPERWEYLRSKLDLLKSIGADLFVSLNEKDKDFEAEILAYDPQAQISIVPNRGRDVLPFLHLARRLDKKGYKYVLKLHAKKSKHRDDGDQWFTGLIDGLIPDENIVADVVGKLKNGTAIVGPAGHFISLKRYMGSNALHMERLLADMYDVSTARKVLREADKYGYFGGTMFWASLEALRPLLDLQLAPEDFESENGQIDGTLAHAVERTLSVLQEVAGNDLAEVDGTGVRQVEATQATKTYNYAP